MPNLAHLIRPDLREFTAYSSARDEAKKGEIWLNANESPWENEHFAEQKINRYPEKQPQKLINALAEIYGVKNNQLSVLRGSDEAIDLLMRLFCEAGKDAIITCPPTFGMYAVYAKLQGAKIIDIPLVPEAGFQLDMKNLVNQQHLEVKLIFLCSPNNPTGNLLCEADILQLCEHYAGKAVIVVDEAYIEFSSANSLSHYIDQYENLVILRTLSKAYGLAGARCGLLLGHSFIINWIKAIMAPYPLPAFTIHAVTQTLMKLQRLKQQIETIKTERERLATELQRLPFVKKIWPSAANFLLLETENSQKIMQACIDSGIVLRDMHGKLFLQNCIRITVGTPLENARLIEFLQTL
ncbi:MAG TPA: histidinol-phosphate transaminase [Gammaproteobacteria bacterium]|nr:histidinol-phosphate transaminase [Gammaproteobacteria bacterium]